MNNFGHFKGINSKPFGAFKSSGGFGAMQSRVQGRPLNEGLNKVIPKGSKLVVTYNKPPATDEKESDLDNSLVGVGGPGGDFSWSPGSNEKEAIYTARKDITNFDKEYGKLIKDTKVKVKIIDPSGKSL